MGKSQRPKWVGGKKPRCKKCGRPFSPVRIGSSDKSTVMCSVCDPQHYYSGDKNKKKYKK